MLTVSLKQQSGQSFETDTSTVAVKNAVAVFQNTRPTKAPFKHWLFKDALPRATCHEIITMPIAAPHIDDTHGKRDSHNELRTFFTPALQQQRYAVRETANIFQSIPVAQALEALCGVSFKGSYLRIEYCQDRGGFWLEPHMDIKEKVITMQVYLNTDIDAATLGTDLYDKNKEWFGRAPSSIGEGMIFVPKEPNSFHGFEKRPVRSVRRSLIINYVTEDWRARHELAFPENPVY